MTNRTPTQKPRPASIDHSRKERGEIPREMTWRLTDLYRDPEAWAKDKAVLADHIEDLLPPPRDWLDTASTLRDYLHRVTAVREKAVRLTVYAQLKSDTDLGDSTHRARLGAMETILVDLQGRLSFIEPALLRLGRRRIDAFLKEDEGLRDYDMFFSALLRRKKHVLSADKEEIVSQTGHFSGTPARGATMLNDLDLPAPRIKLSDGQIVHLNWAGYVRHRGATVARDRRRVMRTFWCHHARFENTFAVLQDGAVKADLFYARSHHHADCLEAALHPQRIDPVVYHTLIRTVKAGLQVLHRYLRLKRSVLGLKRMTYGDVYASAVPAEDRVLSYDEAKRICLDAMSPLGGEYTRVLHNGLEDRWVDVYPNRGKRSGAYSNGGVVRVHPYILMNFNGTLDSVSTLAHEFGHALHSHFSNLHQPLPKAEYPIFLAEIASTFNETLLVHHMLGMRTDPRLKIYVLDQYLERVRTTLFRQTLFAEFELAMHRRVEAGQTLTPEWLNETYLDLTRLYYGHAQGVVHVDEYIRNEWSAIPHFFYNFYVYQYSTGIIAATDLAGRVLSGDRKARRNYLDFLKSGGSRYPLEILKDADVDLTRDMPYRSALERFSEVITEMEDLVGKTGKRV